MTPQRMLRTPCGLLATTGPSSASLPAASQATAPAATDEVVQSVLVAGHGRCVRASRTPLARTLVDGDRRRVAGVTDAGTILGTGTALQIIRKSGRLQRHIGRVMRMNAILWMEHSTAQALQAPPHRRRTIPHKLASLACLAMAGVLLLAAGPAASADDAPRVRVVQGELDGLAQGDTHAFLGIPYARPPLGPLRWQPPQPPAAWVRPRPAQAFSAACMQDAPRPWGPFTAEFVELNAARSEDCLFLNVWTPRQRPAVPLPVLVWIHGGGFGSGAGSVPVYDGARLAARGAVVVSVNYRLGPLGFLSHPALSAESPQKVSGNYGLLDLVAALQWVHANVSSFGGHPDQVTIAGQSAGAAAVQDLLAMPAAKGLFHRAIAMSGAGMGVRAMSLAEAERVGQRLAQEAGADSLAALRELPADQAQRLKPRLDMSAGIPRLVMAPVVDGVVLPVDVETSAAAWASPVPVLSGYMADEGFVMGPPPSTPASFQAHVRQRYGAMADRFLAAYPHADDAQASASMRLIGRDRYMAALVIWAGRRAEAGQAVQGYIFSRPLPGPDAQRFGAFHTGEVPHLFGTLDRRLRPYTEADDAVSGSLQDQVLAFMRDGHLPPPAAWLSASATSVVELGATPVRAVPAVSSPQRLQLFIDHVAAGGQLSMF